MHKPKRQANNKQTNTHKQNIQIVNINKAHLNNKPHKQNTKIQIKIHKQTSTQTSKQTNTANYKKPQIKIIQKQTNMINTKAHKHT